MPGVNIVGVGDKIIIGYNNGITSVMVFCIFLAIVTTSFTIYLISVMFADQEPGLIVLVFLGALITATLFGTTIEIYHRGKPIYNTSALVTIDDSVNFNEFMKKYEILSANGDLYEVIERTE